MISEFNRQAQNPMSEYLLKLQMIVSNTEFKDGDMRILQV